MKFLYLTLTFLIINHCYAQENITAEDTKFCAELAKYRDNELLSDFAKVSNKYQINYQAKIDIADIKQQLLDENKWQMSNAGNAFGQLMSLTKSTCDIILNLLPVSKTNKVALNSYKVYKLYSYGKKGEKFIKNGFEQFVFDEGIKKILGDLNPILSTTTEILKSVSAMKNLDSDWKLYKGTIKNQIKELDRRINVYEVALQNYSDDFERINKYKNYIDEYLNSNCKNTTGNKEDFNVNMTNTNKSNANRITLSDLKNLSGKNSDEKKRILQSYFIQNGFIFQNESNGKVTICPISEYSPTAHEESGYLLIYNGFTLVLQNDGFGVYGLDSNGATLEKVNALLEGMTGGGGVGGCEYGSMFFYEY